MLPRRLDPRHHRGDTAHLSLLLIAYPTDVSSDLLIFELEARHYVHRLELLEEQLASVPANDKARARLRFAS